MDLKSLLWISIKDFNKFAIYICKALIEKFPNLLPGLIAHEIAHIIASRGRVELIKEGLVLTSKDRLEYINAKEKSAEDMYYYFTKEMRSKIK